MGSEKTDSASKESKSAYSTCPSRIVVAIVVLAPANDLMRPLVRSVYTSVRREIFLIP
jgi:hypothetical protein